MSEYVRAGGGNRASIPISEFNPITHNMGKAIYSNYKYGSDGRSGLYRTDPKQTVAAAYTITTEYKGDTIFLQPGIESFYNYATSALDWANDYTNLIGTCAPTARGQRSRITNLSTTTALPYLVDFQGDGCHIENIQIANYGSDAAALGSAIVSGSRNFFINCDFGFPGHATPAAKAAAYACKVTGSENTFIGCHFGIDSIVRGAGDGVSGLLLFDGGASRNTFDRCFFTSYTETTTKVIVKVADTTALDRWTRFFKCEFYNFSVNHAATMASVFSIPASCQTHDILVNDCCAPNIADWDADARGSVWVYGYSPTAATAGIPVHPTVS
jgi:hypothetical protein